MPIIYKSRNEREIRITIMEYLFFHFTLKESCQSECTLAQFNVRSYTFTAKLEKCSAARFTLRFVVYGY